jgi:hypothetical protein
MAIFTTIIGAIAYAGGYLAAAVGFSYAAAVSIGVGLAQLAVSIGLSLISRALQPKIKIPVQEVQAVINQTDAPRRVFVGENLAGGIRAFYDVRSAVLHQIVLVNHGQITGFEEFWIDGEPVEVGVDGNVTTGKYSNFVTVDTRDGSGFGGDYAAVAGNFLSWGASRKIEGQATFYVRMMAPSGNDFSKIFPKSYNTALQWVVKGQAIYDPRDTSTAYRDNAALIIAHYLSHPDGYRLESADINWPSITAMANVADLPIAQKAGGTAPNLRLWGYWTLDEEPINVLDRMHSSSGIRAYEMQDGKIGLIGGNFGTPACTLTAKDIEMVRSSEAISEREGYNVLRVMHMDASQKYTITEVEAWRDGARLAIEGEVVKEYRMEMCPNRSQARRLAKQQLSNDNRAKIEIVTNLVGMKARFPRLSGQRHTIMIDYRPEDGSGRVIAGEYEVMNHDFDPIELKCSIELARVDRASEEWTVEEEGEPPTPLPSSEPNIAPATGAILTQRVITIGADYKQAILEVNAAPLAGRSDVTLKARFISDGNWISMTTSEYKAQSGAVSDGETYVVQARFEGIFDEPPDWDNIGTVTIQLDAIPPGAPSELFASNGTGYVQTNWRNPFHAFAKLRIYRSEGTVFGAATLIGTTGGVSGQISEFQDSTIAAATEYNYWVAAANASGVEGSAIGPANITTT